MEQKNKCPKCGKPEGVHNCDPYIERVDWGYIEHRLDGTKKYIKTPKIVKVRQIKKQGISKK